MEVLSSASDKAKLFAKNFSKMSNLDDSGIILYINNLPDVICNIAIYADDITLYPEYDQASDLRQQLELASELESDLRDTAHWVRK